MLLCLAVYGPGLVALPVIDRDEARFAQASRQMFESVALPESERDPELHAGGLVIPRVAGRDRLNKPPMIYWLQAGAAAAMTGADPMRDAIWMYRLPSVIAAIITVLVTWRLGSEMFAPRVGLLAGAMLAVCPLFAWEAHQARADHVLVACTTLAMWKLWRVWSRALAGARAPWALCAMWVFVALAVYTKGPIGLVVVGLPASMLALRAPRAAIALNEASKGLSGASAGAPAAGERKRPQHARYVFGFRSFRPLLGALFVIAALAPWVFAVASRVGFGAYASLVADEVLGRGVSAKEGHVGPPGYHLVALVLLFWPGVMLTAAGVARAWRRGTVARRAFDAPQDPLIVRAMRSTWRAITSRFSATPDAFLVAWIVPTWILLELYATKLPHYTMPLYPAIAIASARAVAVYTRARKTPGSLALVFWCVQGAIVALGASVAAPWAAGRLAPIPTLEIVTFGVAAIGAATLLWRMFLAVRSRDLVRAQLLSIAVGVLVWIPLMRFAMPRFAGLTTRVVADACDAAPGAPVAAIGFYEDSLDFLTRASIERITPEQQGEFWSAHPEAVAIISDGHLLKDHDVLARVTGLEYARGRVETLLVVRPASLGKPIDSTAEPGHE